MKKMIKTKTFWGGVVAIVTGAGLIFTGDTNQGIQTITMGFLAIFTRDAIRKNG